MNGAISLPAMAISFGWPSFHSASQSRNPKPDGYRSFHLVYEYVGTEHILLGIIREGEGVASAVFVQMRVDAGRIREQILSTVRRGKAATTSGPDLPYTSRAKKSLELAMSEARDLKHSYVGTEHLLLGLLREENGIAAQVLIDNGCTLNEARAETLRLLGTSEEDYARHDANINVIPWAPPPRRPRVYSPGRPPRADRLTGMVYGQLNKASRLSSRAVGVVSAATVDAINRGNRKVGAEHMAGALIDHGEGSAIAVLRLLGADLKKIRQALGAIPNDSAHPAVSDGQMDLSELRSMIDLAENERALSDAPLVATHHLLLAAITASPSVASAMSDAGVDAARIRAAAASISG